MNNGDPRAMVPQKTRLVSLFTAAKIGVAEQIAARGGLRGLGH
jgi:hypothetical protein